MVPRKMKFPMWIRLVAASLLAFAHVPASAAGELAQEFRELTKEAEAGRTHAQYYLALRYLHGVGLPKDEASAVAWFEKAAAGGDAGAAFNLARLFKEGRVVAPDPARAVRLFRLAVRERIPGAGVELGEMLMTGSGTARDYSEAAGLFREAAVLGNPIAAFNLGVMYARGWGLPQDPDEAMRWYERAAEGGEPNAQFNVASALLAKGKTRDDAARAMKLLSFAAAMGVPAAQFTLGRIHEEGTIAPANEVTALRWYRTASENGHEGAMSNLARMLIQRQLGPESDAEAIRLLGDAAGKLDPSALFNLGVLRERGIIVSRDPIAAAEAYRQSAQLGFGPAQLGLAMLLLSSAVSNDDRVNAAAWSFLAREQGAKLQGDGILASLPDSIVAEGRFKAEVLREEIDRTRSLRESGADVATVFLQRVRSAKVAVNGLCISPEGTIIAAYTPIAGVAEIKVRVAGELHPATIIGVDEVRDIAVLSISRNVEHWVARSTTEPADGAHLRAIWFREPWMSAGEDPISTTMRPVASATPFGSDREWLAVDSVWDSAAIGGVLVDERGAVALLTGKRAMGGSIKGVAGADSQEHGVALRADFLGGIASSAGVRWPVADAGPIRLSRVADAMVIVLGF